ncbi:unnamed protein product [Prorocentrum cordatum]|uniref:ADP,ATP carrier protein n=1 Tax=Prorocentrum cordatum TaxID=2364126 RepID=A0ABN9Q0T9_9DINO|nr:unnamed protein product [Polarella glacialis]
MEHKSLARGLAYGGAASCLAEVVTMPVDVVKTRLQMDGAGATRAYRGSLDCAAQLVRSEGPGALFKGLPPALLRQSTYGSMRYGLYAPIRDISGAAGGRRGRRRRRRGVRARQPDGPGQGAAADRRDAAGPRRQAAAEEVPRHVAFATEGAGGGRAGPLDGRGPHRQPGDRARRRRAVVVRRGQGAAEGAAGGLAAARRHRS